jgi:hypothetical protein
MDFGFSMAAMYALLYLYSFTCVWMGILWGDVMEPYELDVMDELEVK